MMASMPAFRELPSGIAAAPGKGAAAPLLAGGIDFSALLSGVEALTPGEPAAAPAIAAQPAVPAQPQLADTAIPGSPISMAMTTEGQPAVKLDAMPAEGDATPDQPDQVAARPAAAPGENRIKPAPTIKLAQSASPLPHLAAAMARGDAARPAEDAEAQPADAGADKEADENGETATGEATDAKAAGPFAAGLALPLLQALAQPIQSAAVVPPGAPSRAMSGSGPAAIGAPGTALPLPIAPSGAGTPERLDTTPADQAIDQPATQLAAPAAASAFAQIQQQARQFRAGAAQPTPPAPPVLDASGRSRTDSGVDAAPPLQPFAATPPLAAAIHAPAPGVQPLAAPPLMPSAVPDTGATLGDRVIDMGVGGQWIDRMAREIADLAAGEGRASFSLNPAHMGRLHVDILQGDGGASVRLTADTDAAAAALHQGRHELQQDARLQAVRIADVQVARGGDATPSPRGDAMAQGQGGQQGQPQGFHKKPLIEAVSTMTGGTDADQAKEARGAREGARYA